MVEENRANLVNIQLVERRRRHLESQRGGRGIESFHDGDVERHEPDPHVVALVDPALHRHDRVVEQLVAELHEGSREHRDFDGAVEVLENEHGHLVALLGELARHVGDDAAEDQHRSVLTLGRLGDPAVDLAPQRCFDTEQRVIGDVQAEHLFLEAQAIALVELVDWHCDTFAQTPPSSAPTSPTGSSRPDRVLRRREGGADDLLEK